MGRKHLNIHLFVSYRPNPSHCSPKGSKDTQVPEAHSGSLSSPRSVEIPDAAFLSRVCDRRCTRRGQNIKLKTDTTRKEKCSKDDNFIPLHQTYSRVSLLSREYFPADELRQVEVVYQLHKSFVVGYT